MTLVNKAINLDEVLNKSGSPTDSTWSNENEP
jgi:hypothetical protein